MKKVWSGGMLVVLLAFSNIGFAGNVNTSDIVNDAVTTPKIADGAITEVKIQNNAVTGTKLADGSVTDSKISGVISANKISFTGLNADTLDGFHINDLAPSEHTHEISSILSLDSELAKKAELNHFHNQYQIKLSNVIIVSKSGGDFTNPAEAINSIIDASINNPYLVKIMPGQYDINQIVYISGNILVEGSGRDITIFKCFAPKTLQLSGLARGFKNLTVVGPDSDYSSAIFANGVSGTIFENMNIFFNTPRDVSYGIELYDSQNVLIDKVFITGRMHGIDINGNNSSVEINDSKIEIEGYNFAIFNRSNNGKLNINNSTLSHKYWENFGSLSLDSGETKIRNSKIYSEGAYNIIVDGGKIEISDSEIITIHSYNANSIYMFGNNEVNVSNTKIIGSIGGNTSTSTIRFFNNYNEAYGAYTYP